MASKNIHELNELNFESTVLADKGLVLVDFTAPWCAPCKALSPLVERIADEAREQVVVGKVDVDAHPHLASRFGIRGLPTLVVFYDGREKARRIGLVKEQVIRELLALPERGERAPSQFGVGHAIG